MEARREVDPAGRLVVDVRPPDEFAAGHDPGALNLQLGWSQLALRVGAYVPQAGTPVAVRAGSERGADEAVAIEGELDPAGEYAVICAAGYRSSQIASLLRRRGFERVWNVIDGMSALVPPAAVSAHPPAALPIRSMLLSVQVASGSE